MYVEESEVDSLHATLICRIIQLWESNQVPEQWVRTYNK